MWPLQNDNSKVQFVTSPSFKVFETGFFFFIEQSKTSLIYNCSKIGNFIEYALFLLIKSIDLFYIQITTTRRF